MHHGEQMLRGDLLDLLDRFEAWEKAKAKEAKAKAKEAKAKAKEAKADDADANDDDADERRRRQQRPRQRARLGQNRPLGPAQGAQEGRGREIISPRLIRVFIQFIVSSTQ